MPYTEMFFHLYYYTMSSTYYKDYIIFQDPQQRSHDNTWGVKRFYCSSNYIIHNKINQSIKSLFRQCSILNIKKNVYKFKKVFSSNFEIHEENQSIKILFINNLTTKFIWQQYIYIQKLMFIESKDVSNSNNSKIH